MVGNDNDVVRARLETESDAYQFLERLRWGEEGPSQCPHCESDKGAWYLEPKNPEGRKSKGGSAARSQRRVWKCKESACRRQFSVLTNTVMHATKMPVRSWVGAVFDLCASNGTSAREIAARWGITEKSAWTMLTRLQDALSQPEIAGANLLSNAPLWFEIPAERVDKDAEKRKAAQTKQDQIAAREHASRAQQEAAQRIKDDVARALAQASIKTPKWEEVRSTADTDESRTRQDLGVATTDAGAHRQVDRTSETPDVQSKSSTEGWSEQHNKRSVARKNNDVGTRNGDPRHGRGRSANRKKRSKNRPDGGSDRSSTNVDARQQTPSNPAGPDAAATRNRPAEPVDNYRAEVPASPRERVAAADPSAPKHFEADSNESQPGLRSAAARAVEPVRDDTTAGRRRRPAVGADAPVLGESLGQGWLASSASESAPVPPTDEHTQTQMGHDFDGGARHATGAASDKVLGDEPVQKEPDPSARDGAVGDVSGGAESDTHDQLGLFSGSGDGS